LNWILNGTLLKQRGFELIKNLKNELFSGSLGCIIRLAKKSLTFKYKSVYAV
jgi:hypothetical protein